jgi:hypothetical protein
LRPISEHFRGVNDSGGIFRRRLELTVVEDIRGVDAKVFAVLGGFAPHADRRLADIEVTRVPTVRVYAEPEAHPPTDRRESFSLMPGHVDQVRSLVGFAIGRKLGFDAGIAVIPLPNLGLHSASSRGRCVPHFDRGVAAGCEEGAAVGGEGDPVNRVVVSAEGGSQFSGGCVPEAQHFVGAARGEGLAVWGEGEVEGRSRQRR